MLDAPNPTKLGDFRRARGKSQRAAAAYFGLAASARTEIGRWESGRKVPPPKYRDRFVGYLGDFLQLGEDPERLQAAWRLVEEAWGWDPLTARERQRCGAPPPPTGASPGGESCPGRPWLPVPGPIAHHPWLGFLLGVACGLGLAQGLS